MTGDTDTRVDPMHAKKMAALMQAEAKNGASKAKADPAAHRNQSRTRPRQARTKQIEESTDMYSFLFWQLGVNP
jgi:prolyl oligopeptidase